MDICGTVEQQGWLGSSVFSSPHSASSMVFDPESATHLKPWLVRTLEPMFVYPALSDYVLYTDFISSDVMQSLARLQTISSHSSNTTSQKMKCARS
jgi:hypothetical protein